MPYRLESSKADLESLKNSLEHYQVLCGGNSVLEPLIRDVLRDQERDSARFVYWIEEKDVETLKLAFMCDIVGRSTANSSATIGFWLQLELTKAEARERLLEEMSMRKIVQVVFQVNDPILGPRKEYLTMEVEQ